MTTLEFAYPIEPGLVSVVIPTYNRARIVKRAITSALSQSYERLEVVVVDDGSTDETPRALHEIDPRVRVICQPNAGPAAARNTGMSQARGEFIAFLDSDDVWFDWKIEAQVQTFARCPDVGIVWTDMLAMTEDGQLKSRRYLREMYGAYRSVDLASLMPEQFVAGDLRGSIPPAVATAPVHVGDLSAAILLGNLLHTPTVVVRREWVARGGAFDPSYRNGGEDYEFYSRICALGRAALVDAAAVDYRVGASDQLTAPEKLIHLAHNDLRAVSARMAEPRRRAMLTPKQVRHRLAQCHAWVGSAELELGRRSRAIKHLVASLWYRPRIDRRGIMLALGLLPAGLTGMLRAIKRPRRFAMSEPR